MTQIKTKKYLLFLLGGFLFLFFNVSSAHAQTTTETSWAWYISRATGLVGFSLLYLSIFFGLAIRTPFLNKLIKPVYSYNIHGWLSVQALFFAAVHGISLLFDKYLNFTLLDVFVPFALSQEAQSLGVGRGILALGIIGFYLMIVLVVTSYGKKYIGHRLWRAIHFLNIFLYAGVFIHALYLGTDLKSAGIARSIFIYANFSLAIIFANNLIFQIVSSVRKNNSLDNPVENQ